MNRTLGDQIERTAFRSVIAEIDFEIVIAGYSLELSASKAGNGLSIERADTVV
jgi:hypothetical protein